MIISKKHVSVKKLMIGMVLAEPIYDIDGKTLFSEGLRLNEKRIERIRSLDLEQVLIEERKRAEVASQTQRVDLPDESTTSHVKSIIEEQKRLRKEKLLNETRQDAATIVEATFDSVLSDSSVKMQKIKKIVEQMIDIIMSDDNMVLNLSNLDGIDNYMLSHSVNVCVYALVTGIYLGFNQQRLVQLGSGALVHDIGKMLVPQDIINKPGPLTPLEFKQIQQHTVYGHKIMKDSMGYEAEVADIALSHHERLDGTGYPNQLSKYDMSLFAKIVSVVDVFDAMTTDKVYKEKVTCFEAVQFLLKHTETTFDLDVVHKFIAVVGHYPIGLNVKLSTGDLGKVITKHKKRPIIRVMVDSLGNKLKNYYEIDLYKNPTISILDIKAS